MLITSLGKIILHMPKCAGSSIRWSIYEQAEDLGINIHYIHEHEPLKSIPDIYKTDKWPVIGFVRSPYTWYSSLYEQKLKGFNRGECGVAVTAVLTNNFSLGFDKFLERATHLNTFFESAEHIKELKHFVSENFMRYRTNWVDRIWPDLMAITSESFSGIKTLYDWWFQCTGLNQANEIYRIEDGVQAGFDTAFPKSGVKINWMNKRNEVQRKRLVLSPEQKEMIRTGDGNYFDQFNYIKEI